MAPPKSALAHKLKDDDPTLLPSDDDDSDFHLSDADTDADHSASSDSDDARPDRKRKRTRAPSPRSAAAQQPALDQAQVDDLWAQFNNPLDDPYATTAATSAAAAAATPSAATTRTAAGGGGDDGDDLVTIEVEYEFAGEKVKQQRKVKRTSAEAQAYFSATRSKTPRRPSPPISSSISSPRAQPAAADPLDALFGPDPSASTATSSSAPRTESPPPPPATTTGPAAKPTTTMPGSLPPAVAKRPRTGAGRGGGLAGMAAALGVGGAGGKPAKLNTLEKSKLDWSSYVSSETGLEDSLAHARKDGYLDRRDFLDRVESSKEEQWDHARQEAAAAARRKR